MEAAFVDHCTLKWRFRAYSGVWGSDTCLYGLVYRVDTNTRFATSTDLVNTHVSRCAIWAWWVGGRADALHTKLPRHKRNVIRRRARNGRHLEPLPPLRSTQPQLPYLHCSLDSPAALGPYIDTPS